MPSLCGKQPCSHSCFQSSNSLLQRCLDCKTVANVSLKQSFDDVGLDVDDLVLVFPDWSDGILPLLLDLVYSGQVRR